jgi:hypothetical protein
VKTTEHPVHERRQPLSLQLRSLTDDPDIVRLTQRLASVGITTLVPMSFVLAAFLAVRPLSDPDTYWHIVMGHKFLDGTSIRHPGAMSAFGTEDWRPRDWLTQITMALFEDRFGLPGVAWLFGLGLVVFVVAMFKCCRGSASFAAAALATPIGLLGSLSSLSARPQLVSFILLSVTVGAVLRTEVDLAPRWWLSPMTGVWACIHGMWFLCVVLQCVVLLGLVLDRRIARKQVGKLLAVVVLSIAAVAVTPNGMALLSKPLGPTNMHLAKYVVESQPPTFPSVFYVAALGMIGAVALSWARGARPSYVQVLLVALAALFAVEMVRTVPIASIILAPLFASAVDQWLTRSGMSFMRQPERWQLLGAAAVALV